MVDGDPAVLARVKEAPGKVSLETMLTEIHKLLAVRAIGVGAAVFGDVAPKVVSGWRARAVVESPSHLRTHPEALRLTLLAALMREREREITDTLVDLLIATVHRVGARAEKKVTTELVNAFKRVSGKESILFRVAEASLAAPDGTVRGVVFPAVSGGEQTLRELVHEFKSNGPVYRRTVQTTLKASYTKHYRRGLIRLLDVLEFRSSSAPMHRALRGDWEDVLHREDARGRRRVVLMVYEVATFQALREALRCGAEASGQWRIPERWCNMAMMQVPSA